MPKSADRQLRLEHVEPLIFGQSIFEQNIENLLSYFDFESSQHVATITSILLIKTEKL